MYSFLNSDINIIEKELEETIQPESLLLRQASMHTLQAGGKENSSCFCFARGKIWLLRYTNNEKMLPSP